MNRENTVGQCDVIYLNILSIYICSMTKRKRSDVSESSTHCGLQETHSNRENTSHEGFIFIHLAANRKSRMLQIHKITSLLNTEQKEVKLVCFLR